MIDRFRLAALSGLACGVLLLASCSKESSEASAEATKDTATTTTSSDDRQASTKTSTQPGSQAGSVAKAQSTTGAGEDQAAADAYEAMLEKINQIQRSAGGSPQAMLGALRQMAVLFEDFIKEYDGTYEALEGRFQLGLIYATLQQGPRAAALLREFIASSDPSETEKLGYAHFYLAEALKASDDFDGAEKHYKIFINDFPTSNPQAVAAARMAIEDLDTLRRLAIGSRPIDFNVKDTNGKDLNLDRFKGKVVLLDFWATWCAPCKAEMPNLRRLHKKYKDKGFEIVGISLDQSRQAFDRYVAQNNIEWPQHFDGRGYYNEVAMKYKIRAIPATFLIDREGKLRYRSIRGPAVEEAVEKLLNETS
jgi:peroxiredoxin/TolA-binding protein